MRRSRVRSCFLILEVMLVVDVRFMSDLGIDLGQRVEMNRDISTVHFSLKQGDWVTTGTVLFQGLTKHMLVGISADGLNALRVILATEC